MKKLLFSIIVGFVISAFAPNYLYAQGTSTPTPTRRPSVAKTTPTPTPEEEPNPIESKIEQLKERVASTVAQLQLVTKKVFIGKITKLNESQLTIDVSGEAKIIELDELTKYFTVVKNSKKEGRFADLSEGDTIIAVGIYNKDSRKLLGRLIIEKLVTQQIIGTVKEVDIKGGTITLEDKRKAANYTVDIEKTTAVNAYENGDGIVKSGLSKIEIGQRAFILGSFADTKTSTISATRVLLLSAKTNSIVTSPPSVTPSPTIKATPTLAKKVQSTPTKKPVSSQNEPSL